MTTLTEPPAWPLPQGHYFGPAATEEANAACHSGKKEWLHNIKLKLWQQHFREVWDRKLETTGEFDADTQDAVEHVQEAAGWEPSGRLDENTWKVVWTMAPPEERPAAKHAKRKSTTRSAFKRSMNEP